MFKLPFIFNNEESNGDITPASEGIIPLCDGSYACLYGADNKLHIKAPCSAFWIAEDTARFWKLPAIANGKRWVIYYQENKIAEGNTVEELEEWKKHLKLQD